MWDKNDAHSKWFRLVVKLIVLLIVFKLGVLVGEFKMVKRMVGGGSSHASMMWSDKGGKHMQFGDATFKKRAVFLKGMLGQETKVDLVKDEVVETK